MAEENSNRATREWKGGSFLPQHKVANWRERIRLQKNEVQLWLQFPSWHKLKKNVTGKVDKNCLPDGLGCQHIFPLSKKNDYCPVFVLIIWINPRKNFILFVSMYQEYCLSIYIVLMFYLQSCRVEQADHFLCPIMQMQKVQLRVALLSYQRIRYPSLQAWIYWLHSFTCGSLNHGLLKCNFLAPQTVLR